ncbi:MAG: NAD(P)H:quinone oxidoreductase [Marmoricola sp.]
MSNDAVKVSVIYYSATGNVDAMARHLAEAAQSNGAVVRLRQVAELAPEEAIEANEDWAAHREATAEEPEAAIEDLTWADVVLLGSPTRFGNIASQLKQYLDSMGQQWQRGELADKVYAGFTSTKTAHGGQETTLLALYNTVIHFGGVLVAPGYTDPVKFEEGNPYGVSNVQAEDGKLAGEVRGALEHLVDRTMKVAQALKVGGFAA